MALLVAEVFLPSFGVLGVGGLVAFVLGSLFLFDGERTGARGRPQPRSPAPRRRGRGRRAGGRLAGRALAAPAGGRRAEGMLGAVGVARERLDPAGTVFVHGEYWTADSDEPLEAGERGRGDRASTACGCACGPRRHGRAR